MSASRLRRHAAVLGSTSLVLLATAWASAASPAARPAEVRPPTDAELADPQTACRLWDNDRIAVEIAYHQTLMCDATCLARARRSELYRNAVLQHPGGRATCVAVSTAMPAWVAQAFADDDARKTGKATWRDQKARLGIWEAKDVQAKLDAVDVSDCPKDGAPSDLTASVYFHENRMVASVSFFMPRMALSFGGTPLGACLTDRYAAVRIAPFAAPNGGLTATLKLAPGKPAHATVPTACEVLCRADRQPRISLDEGFSDEETARRAEARHKRAEAACGGPCPARR